MVRGDLCDRPLLERGMRGADIVYHAAAKVSDWGPWSEFKRGIINGTHHVLEAMRATCVRRIVHVSSVGVYGYRAHYGGIWTEDAPYAPEFLAWEYYALAKIAAEKQVLRYHQKRWVDASVVRPGWVYGPRDRVSFPRLVAALKEGPRLLIGTGENHIHLVYAGNVAEACILAGTKDTALGRVYNAGNDCRITQRQYITAITEGLGFEPVTKHVPASLAMNLARVAELSARLFRKKDPPSITRYGVLLLMSKAIFDSSRARKELGWKAPVGFEEGLAHTLRWYQDEHQPGASLE
jgi:nucleoside-diphosphate-sugar epimerase